jgi:hypothetical protein
MDDFEETNKKLTQEFKEKFKSRQQYNYKCLEKIKEIIERYPDWRFCQILSNIGLDQDRFYEESVDTFNRINTIL